MHLKMHFALFCVAVRLVFKNYRFYISLFCCMKHLWPKPNAICWNTRGKFNIIFLRHSYGGMIDIWQCAEVIDFHRTWNFRNCLFLYAFIASFIKSMFMKMDVTCCKNMVLFVDLSIDFVRNYYYYYYFSLKVTRTD